MLLARSNNCLSNSHKQVPSIVDFTIFMRVIEVGSGFCYGCCEMEL